MICLNRVPVLRYRGYRYSGTFLVHCSSIDLCFSNFPLFKFFLKIPEIKFRKFRLGNGRETLKEKKEQCVYAIAFKPGRK